LGVVTAWRLGCFFLAADDDDGHYELVIGYIIVYSWYIFGPGREREREKSRGRGCRYEKQGEEIGILTDSDCHQSCCV
jgi:hypothetical protein